LEEEIINNKNENYKQIKKTFKVLQMLLINKVNQVKQEIIKSDESLFINLNTILEFQTRFQTPPHPRIPNNPIYPLTRNDLNLLKSALEIDRIEIKPIPLQLDLSLINH